MQYVGKNYGQYISKELQNKTIVKLVEPVHAPEVISRHVIRERMIRIGQFNIKNTRETQRTILESAVTPGIDDTSPMKLAMMENKIAQGNYKANLDISIIMNDLDNTQSSNECRERNSQLTKHR